MERQKRNKRAIQHRRVEERARVSSTPNQGSQCRVKQRPRRNHRGVTALLREQKPKATQFSAQRSLTEAFDTLGFDGRAKKKATLIETSAVGKAICSLPTKAKTSAIIELSNLSKKFFTYKAGLPASASLCQTKHFVSNLLCSQNLPDQIAAGYVWQKETGRTHACFMTNP